MERFMSAAAAVAALACLLLTAGCGGGDAWTPPVDASATGEGGPLPDGFLPFDGAGEPDAGTGDGTREPDRAVEPDLPPGHDEVCVPACAGKECGSDGCGGVCGYCDAGMACAGGVCTTTECGTAPLNVSGTFNTSISKIAFDHASASVYHKQDIDPGEDGCITRVDVTLGYAQGCNLTVSAYGTVSGSKLKVQALSFTADSQCPGFPDKQEGSYTLQGALETGWITLSPLEVPDQNAPTSCFNAKFDVQLAGTMMAYGDEGAISLAISLSTITVQGQVVSSGSTSDKCPCSPNCAGKQCGEDGCGGLCGTCQAGQDCQAGKCSCVPQCAGKECGDNGCGGTCGNCPANYACSYGHCTCNASCTGKECGSDGCGGSCGQCPTGKTCVGNKCKSSCTPSCTGKECGPDGCDGTCGECPEGKTCTDGKCTGGTACCPGNCDSAGDCPSPIDPTKSCYCDSACTQYGDCCSDACSACGYGC